MSATLTDVPEELVDGEDDVDCESEAEGDAEDIQQSPAAFGAMLDAILGSYFEYRASDGSSLNIADILLLIRQSIDRNTDALLSRMAK